MKLALFFALFCVPLSASAAVLIAEPSTQLEILPIKHPEQKQFIYGELTRHPHTFEFVAPQTMQLYAEVSIPNGSEYKKSLIVIREEKRGVSEVGRIGYDNDEWHTVKDWRLWKTFETQEALDVEIETGVYRIEVSSPENLGKYKLVIGTEKQRRGYLESVRDAAVGAGFFGSKISVLRAPIVLFSILVLLGCVWWVRRYFALKYA